MSSSPAERLLGLKKQVPFVSAITGKLPDCWHKVVKDAKDSSQTYGGNLSYAFTNSISVLTRLEDKLNDLRQRLRTAKVEVSKETVIGTTVLTRLPWSNRLEVSRSLSWQLGVRKLLLEIRNAFTQCRKEINSLHGMFRLEFVCTQASLSNTRIRRRTYIDKLREPHYTDRVDPDDFDTRTASIEVCTCMLFVNKTWNDLTKQASFDFKQTEELLWLPPYTKDSNGHQGIKHLMPLGGRQAYSVLITCFSGSISDRKPDEKNLFGWSGDYNHEGDVIKANLARACRELRAELPENPQPGQRLNAPSWQAGSEALQKSVYVPATPDGFVARLSGILSRQCHEFGSYHPSPDDRSLIRSALLCGRDFSLITAQFAYAVRYPQYSKYHFDRRSNANVIARKVMGLLADATIGNAVPTMLTGPIQHGLGPDYFAKCIYAENRQIGETRPHGNNVRRTTIEGYVLFRQGWPDMYHLEQRHDIPEPTSQQISALLDTASIGYFQRQKAAHEIKLSMNTRIARLLKKIRVLPAFTKADSYKVGNCTPGTKQFIDQLQAKSGLPVEDGVPGIVLAKCWRKAEYIQIDRFQSVVEYLTKLHKAQEKERIMNGNPETAVHTEYREEFLDRYSGEDASIIITRLGTFSSEATVPLMTAMA